VSKTDIEKKCPYCKEMFPKRSLREHVEIEHYFKYSNDRRNLKIGLIGALVGMSIVIGMIWGMIF
jgi:hypothetical protein